MLEMRKIAWTLWRAASSQNRQELLQREEEHEQRQEYDEIFVRLETGKLGDV